jgi:hypothetical protein
MPEGLNFTADEIEIEGERLRHFLDAVLERGQLYEIRPVPFVSGGSIWATPEEIPDHVPTLMGWNRLRSNPYFSLNIRQFRGATKGIDSSPGSLIVADFDNGIGLDVVREKLKAGGLPEPTAIVCTSPDHWHCYWRLSERLPDLATFKRLQRGLAEALGSCPNVHSYQQVMRLPGPFCNVKPERPAMPRVKIVECDPNRIHDVGKFPMAAEDPVFEAVPLEQLSIAIEKNSLSDNARQLVQHGITFPDKGRRASIYEAARDMHGRGWVLADATAVLVAAGQKLELEPDNLADIPRQVKNAFATPASPGYAAGETASIDFATSGPTAVVDDEYNEALESIPLPEPPAVPSRPAIALSHGVIGDFMRRVEHETEAHPVALAASLIAATGSIIGRGPHFMVGRTPHYVNLFLAVVGNTGAGRKGTGGDIIRDCVSLADPYWAERCQSPNLVSGEGVIDALRDRVTKLVPVKGGGPDEFEQVVIDPGVEDKRLLITCAELVSAFKAGNRENSTLAQTLREAWDGKTLRTMAKNCARTATDPHLSIIGHATRHELLKVVREADVFGGSMNRFLWIVSERARLLPFGGDLDDLGTVPQRIADVVTFARTIGRMRRSPEADRLWASVYGELTTASGSELLAAVLSRAEAQVLRLSMMFALAAGRATIEVDDLAAALDLWRYSEASARSIFAGVHDALFNRIADAVRQEPGITRTQLHERLGWKLGSSQLVEALGRVQVAGLAFSERGQTKGRPVERWWPTPRAGKEEKQEKPSGGPSADPFPPFSSFPPDTPGAPPVAWDPDNLRPGTFTV